MPNIFWKIYFGLFVVVSGFLLTLLARPWENPAAHVVSLLFFLFTSLSLSLALFAYILQKKILTQIIWQVIALVNFSLFSLISLMSLIDLLAQAELFLIIIFLVCFSFLLPAYIALYLYAFKSPALWPQPATAKGKLLLWKIYFGLFVGVSGLLLLTLLARPWENPAAYGFGLLFFLFTSLSLSLALFAYIWQKKILTQIIWQVIALVNFSLFSLIFLMILVDLFAQAELFLIIFFLVCFSFLLPAYTALYRYAFRSAELWPRLGTAKTKLLPWQSYFYFFLALYPITTVIYFLDPEFFADPEVTGWLKWLSLFDDILLTLISLIGLYAFSWRKRILQPIFWQVFFVIEVLVALIVTPYLIKAYSLSEPDLLSAPALTGGILGGILALIICLPAYVANYLYAFKSKALWRKLKTN